MPETQMEGVSRTLTNLRKLEDVLDAFIVTMSGNRYTAPGIPSKIENIGLLTLLYSTMNSFMGLLNRLYAYKADYIVVELQDMLILIYAVDSNTALVCIVPSLANVGLISVEIESSRREIKALIG